MRARRQAGREGEAEHGVEGQEGASRSAGAEPRGQESRRDDGRDQHHAGVDLSPPDLNRDEQRREAPARRRPRLAGIPGSEADRHRDQEQRERLRAFSHPGETLGQAQGGDEQGRGIGVAGVLVGSERAEVVQHPWHCEAEQEGHDEDQRGDAEHAGATMEQLERHVPQPLLRAGRGREVGERVGLGDHAGVRAQHGSPQGEVPVEVRLAERPDRHRDGGRREEEPGHEASDATPVHRQIACDNSVRARGWGRKAIAQSSSPSGPSGARACLASR